MRGWKRILIFLNDNQFTLPTSTWSKGVYILLIKTADAVQTKQFVVGN